MHPATNKPKTIPAQMIPKEETLIDASTMPLIIPTGMAMRAEGIIISNAPKRIIRGNIKTVCRAIPHNPPNNIPSNMLEFVGTIFAAVSAASAPMIAAISGSIIL